MDTCTRFVLCYPLKKISAINVAEILLQQVFFTFGFCKSISTDRGVEFKNSLIDCLTKALHIDHHFATVNKHESILSERAIRSISDILVTKLTDHGKNWPLYIHSCVFAYNCSPHTALADYSPYELLFARPPPQTY
jgi:hypothetical protein